MRTKQPPAAKAGAGDETSVRFLCENPEQAAQYWRTVVERERGFDHEKEHLVVLLLNTRRMVKSHEVVSIGTLDTLIIHPREVFSAAVKARAAAIVIMHNHPSGDPSPSEADIRVTRSLVEAGKLLRIEVLDHVIVGNGRHCSLKEMGHIDGQPQEAQLAAESAAPAVPIHPASPRASAWRKVVRAGGDLWKVSGELAAVLWVVAVDYNTRWASTTPDEEAAKSESTREYEEHETAMASGLASLAGRTRDELVAWADRICDLVQKDGGLALSKDEWDNEIFQAYDIGGRATVLANIISGRLFDTLQDRDCADDKAVGGDLQFLTQETARVWKAARKQFELAVTEWGRASQPMAPALVKEAA